MRWLNLNDPVCPRCTQRGGVCKLEGTSTLVSADFAAVPVLDVEVSDEGWIGSVGRDYEGMVEHPCDPAEAGFDPHDPDSADVFFCLKCKGVYSPEELGEAQMPLLSSHTSTKR